MGRKRVKNIIHIKTKYYNAWRIRCLHNSFMYVKYTYVYKNYNILNNDMHERLVSFAIINDII